ncbi:pseudouridylate synthase [Plasmodium inui San Antonio 1]|uniref:Pseudouridylate synthase n=1 Tax=Plasmodium inui San Antonio 1 TaxID=1237626 RepID=W7AUP8_9APIC|nr:pseudouridylate synthase [Plasmodium inui San Antonio 1]EUD69131.1 pseudouridylate synthase [Plasmodium inui San Antonio 1]
MLVSGGVRWRGHKLKGSLHSWGGQLHRHISDNITKEVITHSYDRKKYEQNVQMYDTCKSYVDSKQKIFYDYVKAERPMLLPTIRGGQYSPPRKKNNDDEVELAGCTERGGNNDQTERYNYPTERNINPTERNIDPTGSEQVKVKYLCEYKKWSKLISKRGSNRAVKDEAEGEIPMLAANKEAEKAEEKHPHKTAPKFSDEKKNHISNDLMHISIDNSKFFCPNKKTEGSLEMKITQYCWQEGLCSSRFAFNNLRRGIIQVNNQVVFENVVISPGKDKVELTKVGKHLLRNKNITIILNKPKYYLSILNDHKTDKKLLARNLIRNENKFIEEEHKCMSYFINKNVNIEKVNKLYVCGRLDANSTGLLVFTQNTLISSYLLNKHKYQVEKEYIIRTADPIGEDHMELLRRNALVDGKLIYKCRIQYVDCFTLSFTLYQGFHKIIRKLCLLSNIKIRALHRVRIGGIHLKGTNVKKKYTFVEGAPFILTHPHPKGRPTNVIMFNVYTRGFSKKAGWSWIKNRRGRKKIISFEYPPKERSSIVKLTDQSDKLVFVCNGKLRDTFMTTVKSMKETKCVVKNDTIWTPCLVVSKAKCHTLLESFTYDEILHLEKLAPRILQAFEEAQGRLHQDEQNRVLSKHEAVKFRLLE